MAKYSEILGDVKATVKVHRDISSSLGVYVEKRNGPRKLSETNGTVNLSSEFRMRHNSCIVNSYLKSGACLTVSSRDIHTY